MVTLLTKENFKEIVEQSDKPVVLDIFATWCGPCQYMKPIFHQVAQELGDRYIFAELNVDESRDLAVQFSVTSVPTFLFIKQSKVEGRETGYMGKDDLKAKIQEYLG
ncbi:MAG TPA: thioredoxin [Candidatus Babeliaceae bacterium]|nr:thioredoxin [Candidatus Babeliaceae bacterium]